MSEYDDAVVGDDGYDPDSGDDSGEFGDGLGTTTLPNPGDEATELGLGGWSGSATEPATFQTAGCCCFIVDGAGNPTATYGYDTTGQGVANTAAIDSDGDGVADAYYVDSNRDGVWDEVRDSSGVLIGAPSQAQATPADDGVQAVPVAGTEAYPASPGPSGQPELVIKLPDGTQISLPAVDADGDGVAESASFDQNGDGKADVFWVDTTGDGVADTMLLDANRDGQPDEFLDQSQTGAWEPKIGIDAGITPQPDGMVVTLPSGGVDGQVVNESPPVGQPDPVTGESVVTLTPGGTDDQLPQPSGVAAETGSFWAKHFPGEPIPQHSDPGMQLAMMLQRIEQVPNWQSDPELAPFHDQTKALLDQWNATNIAVVTPWLRESAESGEGEAGEQPAPSGEETAEQPQTTEQQAEGPQFYFPADGSIPDWYRDLEWSQTQSEDGFCVPASVAMIVSEFSGHTHGEMEIVQAAITGGWLEQVEEDGKLVWSGMDADEAAQLLEHFDIPAHVERYGTPETLAEYLAQGREIIVAVDSDEIWYEADDDSIEDAGPDHALLIKSIDPSLDQVILFDPGNPDVPIAPLTIAEFMDAWEGKHELVVTDVVSPAAISDARADEIIAQSPSEQSPIPPGQPQPESQPGPTAPEMVSEEAPAPDQSVRELPADPSQVQQVPTAMIDSERGDSDAKGGLITKEFDGDQRRNTAIALGATGAVLVPLLLRSLRPVKQ